MTNDDTRRRKSVVKVLSVLLALASVVAVGHGVAAEPGNGKGGGQDTGGGGGGNGDGGGGGKPTTTTSSTTTSTTSTTLAPSGADIAVAIDDDADPATLGEILTYTVTVDNVGTTAADNVATVVRIRHGDVRGVFAYDEVSTTQGSCTAPTVSEVQYFFSERSFLVECALGTVPAGSRVTITVAGRPTYVTRSTERARPALKAEVFDWSDGSDASTANDRDFEYTDVTVGDPTHDCVLYEAWVSTYDPLLPARCADGGALPGGGQ